MKVSIALIQTSSEQQVQKNVSKTVDKIAEVASQGANIVCTQELFTSDYFCNEMNDEYFSLAEQIPGPTTGILCETAKKHGVVVVASLFEKRANGVYHNTGVVIDADGSYLGKYRKMHIPDDPGFCEKYYFTPGDLGYKVFKTQYGNIGLLICWDQWYPEAARITAMMGADILIYPTAIATLPEETDQDKRDFSDAWITIQRSHAIANGVFVASINRVGTEKGMEFWGGSFVCNPFGKIQAKAGDGDESLISECDFSSIDKHRTTWPFFRDRRIDSYQPVLQRYLDE